MMIWQKVTWALATVVFGVQALLGLLAAGWLVVHPLPAGQVGMPVVWLLMCPVPLLGWMCRPQRPVDGGSLRRVCAWAAVMVAVLLLQVPLTKAFLATTPLYEVLVGVLIVVSEFLRFAVAAELDGTDDAAGENAEPPSSPAVHQPTSHMQSDEAERTPPIVVKSRADVVLFPGPDYIRPNLARAVRIGRLGRVTL